MWCSGSPTTSPFWPRGRFWPAAVRQPLPAMSVSAKPISAAPRTKISWRRPFMLSLRDVHVHLGKLHILQGVNLEVKPGESAALLGRNGVGKTTTLRAIMGLAPRSGGTVEFEGLDLGEIEPHQVPRKG